MSRLVERVVHGLRVVIDRDQCVGFGDCVKDAPEGFKLDEDSIARSTAQSECCELSTGAKISRYTGTSDARVHAGHTPISPRAWIGFGPIEITPGVMLGRSGRQAAARLSSLAYAPASMASAAGPVKS